jgi:hypothetical protein
VKRYKYHPLDPARLLGSVSAVFPGRVEAVIPDVARPRGQWLYGHRLGTGQVGEFVLVDSEPLVVVGRVTSVRVTGRERATIEPEVVDPFSLAPVAEIKLLATFDRQAERIVAGVPIHPRIGARVYSPSATFLADLVTEPADDETNERPVLLPLGAISDLQDAMVETLPEKLFGRHCAVLGTTGAGKSFTLAHFVEEIAKHQCKAVFLDPTGEYANLWPGAKHCVLGANEGDADATNVPFAVLDEQDLFALFTPSGRAQGPRFRQAIESLRMAEIAKSNEQLRGFLTEHSLLHEGLIKKSGREIAQYEKARLKYLSEIERPNAPLDVLKLAKQIGEECVFPTARGDAAHWGDRDDTGFTHCLPLISRIHALVRAPELSAIFKGVGANLFEKLEEFLADQTRVLRVSLELVPHMFNAREVIANAIGRRLLAMGRHGRFREGKPVIVFLDEAHHFLNRHVGHEDAAVYLDAFELIAKEGRKYWLTICLATQRPRDLPEGVLSQVGTMVVHRLINDNDRDIVERACGEIDRTAAAFLPTLAPGEAALIGVDFPFPMTVQMIKPTREPRSKGPEYQKAWKAAAPAAGD